MANVLPVRIADERNTQAGMAYISRAELAVNNMRNMAETNDLSDMTLSEINEIFSEARKEKEEHYR